MTVSKPLMSFTNVVLNDIACLSSLCETDTGILQNGNDLNGSRRLQAGDVKSPLLDPLS